MQTYLHGRDLIGDLDFSQRGSRNRPGCGVRSEAQARAERTPRVSARQGAGDAVLLQQHPHPRLVRGRHGPARRPRRVHRFQHHPDFPRRHPEGDRRDLRPLLRRHRHPPLRLADRQRLPERGRAGVARAGAQHAVRHLPPLPVPGRPDDDHREEGPRPAQEEDGRLVGVCRIVPQADLGAAIADPADAALRHGCHPGLPAGVHADAGDRGMRPRSRRASTRPTSRSSATRTAWMPRSRTRTSSTPSRGGRC